MSADREYSEEITVENTLGLHARPAAQIVRMLGDFQAEVTLTKADDPGSEADCRSVLSLLMLAAARGTRMRVQGSGEDAEKAVRAVADFFRAKCGEE